VHCRQAQQAKDFAEQVRFETRPEVRRVVREYFQARRDALGAAERDKQERDRREKARAQDEFLAKAFHAHEEIREGTTRIATTHEALERQRHEEARQIKEHTQTSLERARHRLEAQQRLVKAQHDAVICSRFDPSSVLAVRLDLLTA
jgi:hypothetical protein